MPEEVTLALGGYEEVPLEGRVELLGKPVRGARVEGGLAPVETDENGRFRLYAPRAGARLKALPPEGLLALPTEVSWKPGDPPPVLALRPASVLRLRCEGGGRGAHLVGEVGAFVPCGGEAFLFPGTYRLLPEALPGFRAGEEEVALEPLGRKEVLLAFTPIPTVPLSEARPLRVEWPLEVAPGEVAQVRVRLEGGSPGEVSLSLPVLGERREGDDLVLLFQVPWEARERLEVVLRAKGGESRVLLPLNPGKELLSVRLDPPRASLGERVRVRVETLFPAEEVHLVLPTGALPLRREGEGPPWVFVGTFRVEEALFRGAERFTGSLAALSLQVKARQGEVERGKEVRLLLR
ncbi:hypothetical protein [Thermus antranikianii]|uniref:Carboxypeptidase regulatory-like domain-containing protein n=1 Tax=Thermus antranikianii TaxID=88190 RepID=A0ABY7RRE6_9DEIN|nr:hypothetical protein [Thermus antranikianii]WCM40266.1 hypothetical protein GO600_09285 [Thermus antranikianii]